jgi:hypothetical protein
MGIAKIVYLDFDEVLHVTSLVTEDLFSPVYRRL